MEYSDQDEKENNDSDDKLPDESNSKEDEFCISNKELEKNWC